MKFRTKIAIFVLASFLSLAGFNLIANSLTKSDFVADYHTGTQVTFEVSNVHSLV